MSILLVKPFEDEESGVYSYESHVSMLLLNFMLAESIANYVNLIDFHATIP